MTGGRPLDGSWPGWLAENIARGCNTEQLAGILRKNGFAEDSIRHHMGAHYPATLAPDATGPDYAALCRIRLTRPDSGLNVQQLLTDKLQLYTIENFLDAAECARIVDIASQHLRPSTVTTGNRDIGYRTSSTSDLGLLDNGEVMQLDEKISLALGIRLSYSEGIQAQRYETGQEFKQHTDYFAPNSAEYQTYAGNRGQRTWTFMVYLNEGMTGGGTKFFAVDKVFTPRLGMAVVWNNLRADGRPNPNTLHSGLPVESGHKIIITKWFRANGTGPMLL